MSEVITLSLPPDRRFATVARIVVGGLAARLDLPFEALDDVQLAVESVLAEEALLAHAGEQVTLEVSVASDQLALSFGPVDPDRAPQMLTAADQGFGLRTILAAVVDGVRLDERDGSSWIVLEKRVPVRPGA